MCGVQPLIMAGEERTRLATEKFQGCVVPLTPSGAELVHAIRGSSLNRRIVIYGVATDEPPAESLLQQGINVVFKRPVLKSEAVTRVHSTSPLLIHEMRRYIRSPVALPVGVMAGAEMATFMSREISAGGLSLETGSHRVPTGPVRLSLALPDSPPVAVAASACWHLNRLTGFRFDEMDAARASIKRWVDGWLAIT